VLITTCTHCLARFRVTPQQLNVKQGQVRCGRCGKVFSGFEALERFPDDDTGARLLAAREAAAKGGDEAPQLSPEPLPEVQPVDAPPPTPARTSYVEPPARPSTPHRATAARQAAPRIEYEETDPATRAPSKAWAFGAFLLLLVLAAESVYAFRAQIAQRYPEARSWLTRACAQLACSVAWPRNEQQLKLEDSELLEVPGHPGEISLTARVRNLAAFAQEYPFIELTLTDITGQPTARRVLRPADYLGRAPSADDAFAAGSELAIQLQLATPGLKPTGYQLLLFYP
jgi:predicted Zn finger-like uncharacterized protein